jgi:hypothetical protein
MCIDTTTPHELLSRLPLSLSLRPPWRNLAARAEVEELQSGRLKRMVAPAKNMRREAREEQLAAAEHAREAPCGQPREEDAAADEQAAGRRAPTSRPVEVGRQHSFASPI